MDRSVQTAFLLDAFSRFVTHFRPGFIVVENVPGFLTRHSSPRATFIEALSQQGYTYAEGLVNSNDYGVPQNRIRYLLIASRLVPHVALPPKKTGERPVVRSFIDPERGFNRLAAGQRDVGDPLHAAARLSEQNLLRIRRTPHSGGNRASWSADPALQIDAYKGRDEIFRDVYGRMAWDRPAPTITTRFNSFSNGRFGHPDQDRAISLREGAALQTFPKSFVFHGPNVASVARQIGNAVPPELARRIGHHIGRVINRA